MDAAPDSRIMAVSPGQLRLFSWLADGALVLHLSYQQKWVYVRVVKDGRARTRRYRHDQLVKVEALPEA